MEEDLTADSRRRTQTIPLGKARRLPLGENVLERVERYFRRRTLERILRIPGPVGKFEPFDSFEVPYVIRDEDEIVAQGAGGNDQIKVIHW